MNKKVSQLVSRSNHRLNTLILIFPRTTKLINIHANILAAMF